MSYMKKRSTRIVCMLLAVLMLLSMFPAAVLATDGYVEGIESAAVEIEPFAEPTRPSFPIGTAAQLTAFFNGTLTHPDYPELGVGRNDDHFHLTASFTAAAADTQGRGYVGGQPFTGVFDGRGHTITGLRLRRVAGTVGNPGADITGNVPHNTGIGLIRVAGDGARIVNLTLHHTAPNSGTTGVPTDANMAFRSAATANLRVGMIVGRVISGSVTIESVRLTGRTFMQTDNAANAGTMRLGAMVGHVDAQAGANLRDISVNDLESHTNFTGTTVARTHSVGGVVGSSSGTVHITTSEGAPRNSIAVMVRGGGRYNRFNLPFRIGGVLAYAATGSTTLIENTNVTGSPRLTRDATGFHADFFIRGSNFAGGFVATTGSVGTLTIRNARNDIWMSGARTNARIGGIIGRSGMTTRLENVENHGMVRMIGTDAPSGSQTINAASDVGGFNLGGIIGRSDGVTTIIGTVNRGNILSRPGGTRARSIFMGGIIGVSNGRTVIEDATNYGQVIRAGSPARSGAHVGGIIGHIHNGGTAANRRTELYNVTNRGQINDQTGTTVTRNAGGIVGHVRDRASAIVIIEGATNHSAVRARQNAGGIIGFANCRNITITGAMNYGAISSSGRGTTVAALRVQRSGGIVGLSSRANMRVFESGNWGQISGGGTANGTAAVAGHGGLVGRSTGAGFRVEESFNGGFITTGQFNTGGLVGSNRGAATLFNVYNIGSVRTTATRGGAGILGRRNTGTVRIENAFISYNSPSGTAAGAGTAVAVSGTGTARPVAGLVFRNVYVDQTTFNAVPAAGNANRLQNQRPGVELVTTELLTADILPGISGGPWLAGMVEPDGVTPVDPFEYRTYPFFDWQTGGTRRLQERFFQHIRIGAENAMDLAGPGNRTVNFEGVRPTLTSRVFNPYLAISATVGAHPLWSAGATSGTAVAARGAAAQPISMGLVSTDYVVGFGTGEVPDRIEIRAYCLDTYNATGERFIIPWAHFEPANAGRAFNGLFLLEFENGEPMANRVYATATGYAPNDVYVPRFQQPHTRIYIPMTRVPIDVAVYVRNQHPNADSDDGADELGPINDTTSELRYTTQVIVGAPTRTPITRNPGTGNAAFFPLTGALVRDWGEATAPFFSVEDFEINPLDFRRDDSGNYILTADGRFILDVELEDIRLPNFDIVPYEYIENADEELVITRINIGPVATPLRNLLIDDPHPLVNPTQGRTIPGTPSNANPQRFNISGATTATEFQVTDVGTMYADGDVFTVAYDDLDEDEYETADLHRPNRVLAELRRLADVHVRVIEEVRVYDANGDFVTAIVRPVPAASVSVEYGGAITARPEPAVSEFTVRAVEGSIITATAPGFESNIYPHPPEASHVVTPDDFYTGNEVLLVMRRSIPAGHISGYVIAVEYYENDLVDLDVIWGEPMANMPVVIRTGSPTGSIVATTTTNAYGRYLVDVREFTGPFFVSAVVPGYLPSQSHHNPVIVEGERGARADVLKTFTAVYNLELTVTGPADMADVTLMFQNRFLSRDGNIWSVRNQLRPEAPQLGSAVAWADGYRPNSATIAATDYDEITRYARETIALERITTPADRGVIEGVVRDAETRLPIPGAVVTVRLPNGTTRTEIANQYGHYEFRDLETAGPHIVTARHPGYAPGMPEITPTTVVLGQVVTAHIDLEPEDEDSYLLLVHVIGGTPTSVTLGGAPLTLQSGVWVRELANPTAGSIVATASGFRHAPATVAVADYTPGRVAIVVIILEEVPIIPGTGSIYGWVRDESGAPIPGATVTAVGPGNERFYAETNENGFYVITNVPPARYTVVAAADEFGYGFSYENPAIVVADAAVRANVILEDDEDGDYAYMLIVTVTGPADPATVTVVIDTEDGRIALTRDTDSGVWYVRSDAPIEGRVRATANNFFPATADVEEDDYVDRLALVLIPMEHVNDPPRPGEIRGFVRETGTTNGIPGAIVTAIDENGLAHRVVADEDGFYHFKGLRPTGRYTLIAEDPRGEFGTAVRPGDPVVPPANANIYLTRGGDPYKLIVFVTGGDSAPSIAVTHGSDAMTSVGDRWQLLHSARLLGRAEAAAQGYLTVGEDVTLEHYTVDDILGTVGIVHLAFDALSLQAIFHFYGFDEDPVTVPIVVGEAINMAAVTAAMSELEEDLAGFAFWGWFEDAELTASGRTRPVTSANMSAGLRRPTVGTNGFNMGTIITQELFDDLEQNSAIHFYAIWALWGDVNDDDQVNGADVNLLSRYVLEFPNTVIVRPAAYVTRGANVTGADVNLLSRYVLEFPGIVLGRLPQ